MLTYDKKQMLRLRRWLGPAVLFVLLVLCFQPDTVRDAFAQEERLKYGWTLDFVLKALQTDAALLSAPILCTFPFASACMDEVRSGMIKNILCRTDRESYLRSKALTAFAAGALTMMTAVILVWLLSFLLFGALEALPEAGANQNEAVRQLMGLAFRYGCFGGLWSLTGMLLSLLTMNRFMAWISPFIIDYLLVILHERYFDRLLLCYPRQWIACTWQWPLGDAGICLWLLLLSGLAAILTVQTGRRLLSHVV